MHTMVCPDESRPLSSVLIVDDHPLYSDALASTLRRTYVNCEVRAAGSLSEALALMEDGFDPDLLMLDLRLPDVTGISGFEQLSQRLNGTSVLVISSMASAELVRELLELGAMGFMPKESPASTLRLAVSEISAGRRYIPKEFRAVVDAESAASEDVEFASNPGLAHLTRQQKRILKLICAGKPNKVIAYELSLAETTVKAHITALLRRLGVTNRTQAAVMVETLQSKTGDAPEVRAFLRN